jgi:hypothetical protein
MPWCISGVKRGGILHCVARHPASGMRGSRATSFRMTRSGDHSTEWERSRRCEKPQATRIQRQSALGYKGGSRKKPQVSRLCEAAKARLGYRREAHPVGRRSRRRGRLSPREAPGDLSYKKKDPPSTCFNTQAPLASGRRWAAEKAKADPSRFGARDDRLANEPCSIGGGFSDRSR